MQAILISIQPKWCERIASKKKRIEVRKTIPKLKLPFKCYIYCTKAKDRFSIGGGLYAMADTLYRLPTGEIKFGDGFELMGDWSGRYDENNFLNGKIIGEFICDSICNFGNLATDPWSNLCGSTFEYFKKLITQETCLSESDFRSYRGKYGYHITNLVIYDKPRDLETFFYRCNKPVGTDCSKCVDQRKQSCKPIKRPPQSWCYVESGA